MNLQWRTQHQRPISLYETPGSEARGDTALAPEAFQDLSGLTTPAMTEATIEPLIIQTQTPEAPPVQAAKIPEAAATGQWKK